MAQGPIEKWILDLKDYLILNKRASYETKLAARKLFAFIMAGYLSIYAGMFAAMTKEAMKINCGDARLRDDVFGLRTYAALADDSVYSYFAVHTGQVLDADEEYFKWRIYAGVGIFSYGISLFGTSMGYPHLLQTFNLHLIPTVYIYGKQIVDEIIVMGFPTKGMIQIIRYEGAWDSVSPIFEPSLIGMKMVYFFFLIAALVFTNCWRKHVSEFIIHLESEKVMAEKMLKMGEGA